MKLVGLIALLILSYGFLAIALTRWVAEWLERDRNPFKTRRGKSSSNGRSFSRPGAGGASGQRVRGR
jgi:hypothetical protein